MNAARPPLNAFDDDAFGAADEYAAPDFAKAIQPQRGAQQVHTIAQTVENAFPSLE